MAGNACPNCGDLNFSILTERKNFTLLKCIKCGLVKRQFAHINIEQFYEMQDSLVVGASHRLYDRTHYRKAKDRMDILKKTGKTSGKLLEIGCATGEFLEIARDYGFDVMGLDASEIYAKRVIDKRLEVKIGRLQDIEFEELKFDVVAMFHLFEHIDKPGEFLEVVNNCMRPNGLLYIIVPNIDSLTNRFFGFNHPIFLQPDHLFYYSKNTLKGILEKTGFKVVKESSKEYVHHFLTSFISLIRYAAINRRKNANESNEKTQIFPVQGPDDKFVKRIIRYTRSLARHLSGYILYPFFRPYGLIVENFVKGHELVLIARKQ